VRFENFSCPFEQERLRNMKPGKIGGSAGGFVESDPQHGVGFDEQPMGFVEKA
jgi:hypothetical protein